MTQTKQEQEQQEATYDETSADIPQGFGIAHDPDELGDWWYAYRIPEPADGPRFAIGGRWEHRAEALIVASVTAKRKTHS